MIKEDPFISGRDDFKDEDFFLNEKEKKDSKDLIKLSLLKAIRERIKRKQAKDAVSKKKSEVAVKAVSQRITAVLSETSKKTGAALLKYILPVAIPIILILIIFMGSMNVISGILVGITGSDSGIYEDIDYGSEDLNFYRLQDDEIAAILDTIEDPLIYKVLDFALNHVGDAYNQDNRFGVNTFDCSSFAYRAYKEIGRDISFYGASTAAAECQGLEEAEKRVKVDEFLDIMPGDLIFYSYEVNNRYKNVSHVAIYAGSGMIVDAKGVKYGVVYRSLPKNKIVSVCRVI